MRRGELYLNILTHFIGMLSPDKVRLLDSALLIALQIQVD